MHIAPLHRGIRPRQLFTPGIPFSDFARNLFLRRALIRHLLMLGLGCMGSGGNFTRGLGTVPQKGVVFVKFQLFPKCFFSVCMIILGYCTHVFSIRTFYISIYEQNRDISIFWWPKFVKNVTFFWSLPVFFLDVL